MRQKKDDTFSSVSFQLSFSDWKWLFVPGHPPVQERAADQRKTDGLREGDLRIRKIAVTENLGDKEHESV
jgi:hypothetical protein